MPRKVVQQIQCYEVHAGDGDGGYDKSAVYDDLDACLRDVRAAIEANRQVLIEPALMSEAEYESEGAEFPEGVNPLL